MKGKQAEDCTGAANATQTMNWELRKKKNKSLKAVEAANASDC